MLMIQICIISDKYRAFSVKPRVQTLTTRLYTTNNDNIRSLDSSVRTRSVRAVDNYWSSKLTTVAKLRVALEQWPKRFLARTPPFSISRCFPQSFPNRKLNQDQSIYIFNTSIITINPLNPELNPICYLLALLGAHHFLHVSRIKVKLLKFRLLMSYIYIWSTHSWCF